MLRIVIVLSCRLYIPGKAAGLSTVLHACSCFCVCSVKRLFADVETSFGVFSALGSELRLLPRRCLQMGIISMQMVVETCRCTPLHFSHSYQKF